MLSPILDVELELTIYCRYIHWVAESPAHNSPVKAEVRAFNRLFKSANPAAHSNGFLADINPNSEEIFPKALVDIGFAEIRRRAPWPKTNGMGEDTNSDDDEAYGPQSVRFQGMRVGYFCEDKESSSDHVVLNRIVSLKEDPGKV